MIRVVLFEGQFADVTADRVTFEGQDIVVWFDGAKVGRHHRGIVEALEIVGVVSSRPAGRTARARRRPRPVPLLLPRP